MTGRHPRASFGNSTGDCQMLDFTKAGKERGFRCSRCVMTPLQNDAEREYADGPAKGPPDTNAGPSPRRYTAKARRMDGLVAA